VFQAYELKGGEPRDVLSDEDTLTKKREREREGGGYLSLEERVPLVKPGRGGAASIPSRKKKEGCHLWGKKSVLLQKLEEGGPCHRSIRHKKGERGEKESSFSHSPKETKA